MNLCEGGTKLCGVQNVKTKYVDGITLCADCGVELVDELPEETDEVKPVRLCHVANEEIGAKLVLYLNVEGVLTAGIMPVTEEDEFDDGFYVVVAKEEYDEKAETFDLLTVHQK